MSSSLRRCCASMIPLVMALIGSAAATSGERITMDEVFSNVVPEILERSWDDFEVRGDAPDVRERYTKFFHSIRGPKMWGYCNPDLEDPCDCDCAQGVDPCLDPASQTILKEGRQTVQLYLPNNVDFAVPPLLYVDKSGPHDSQLIQEKVMFARGIARKGMVAVIWSEEDVFPVGAEPVPKISEQFGFNGPAEFQREGCKHWLRSRDPLNLAVEDLRMDDRYHNTQSYVLAVTFFQRLVEDVYAGDPIAAAWAASAQVFFVGGSKAGGAAYTAAGIDPRAVALMTTGFMEFDTEQGAAAIRYETDWRECPSVCPAEDTCSPQDPDAHPWYRYANWLRTNKDNLPSYWDTYRMGRNRDRYRHLMLLEVAGTHDWINPLGSDAGFWDTVDGMTGGLPDPTEDRWDFRLVRRINSDHGTSYTVGRTDGGRDVRGDQLLLFRTMMQLHRGRANPRIESAGLDVSGDPSVDPWIVRVRVTDLPGDHDPAAEERYKIHVALGDDRDFRRCTPPIRCRHDDEVPCDENGVCRDADWDDNRDEEDHFIKIRYPDYDLVVDGEFRELIFQPPVEALAFIDPLVAVIVEVRIDDTIPFDIKDDWVMHTDVQFGNEGLYPEYHCCPE